MPKPTTYVTTNVHMQSFQSYKHDQLGQMLQTSMQVSIDSASSGQIILYSVQCNNPSGWRTVPLFQSHHPQNITIATPLIRLESQLSPILLDMCYILPSIHLLHIQYCCSLKTGCIDTMFTAGANSVPCKRAQFQHPGQSTHTTSSDNLLLDCQGTSSISMFMPLAS